MGFCDMVMEKSRKSHGILLQESGGKSAGIGWNGNVIPGSHIRNAEHKSILTSILTYFLVVSRILLQLFM